MINQKRIIFILITILAITMIVVKCNILKGENEIPSIGISINEDIK